MTEADTNKVESIKKFVCDELNRTAEQICPALKTMADDKRYTWISRFITHGRNVDEHETIHIFNDADEIAKYATTAIVACLFAGRLRVLSRSYAGFVNPAANIGTSLFSLLDERVSAVEYNVNITLNGDQSFNVLFTGSGLPRNHNAKQNSIHVVIDQGNNTVTIDMDDKEAHVVALFCAGSITDGIMTDIIKKARNASFGDGADAGSMHEMEDGDDVAADAELPPPPPPKDQLTYAKELLTEVQELRDKYRSSSVMETKGDVDATIAQDLESLEKNLEALIENNDTDPISASEIDTLHSELTRIKQNDSVHTARASKDTGYAGPDGDDKKAEPAPGGATPDDEAHSTGGSMAEKDDEVADVGVAGDETPAEKEAESVPMGGSAPAEEEAASADEDEPAKKGGSAPADKEEEEAPADEEEPAKKGGFAPADKEEEAAAARKSRGSRRSKGKN